MPAKTPFSRLRSKILFAARIDASMHREKWYIVSLEIPLNAQRHQTFYILAPSGGVTQRLVHPFKLRLNLPPRPMLALP